MKRTQIQFTEEQARRLREVADEEGRSMSDLVRESVSEYLSRRPGPDPVQNRRRALEIVGRYRSGTPDIAEDHDRYLHEAYGEEG